MRLGNFSEARILSLCDVSSSGRQDKGLRAARALLSRKACLHELRALSGLVMMAPALAVLSQVSFLAIAAVAAILVGSSAGNRALLSDPGISIAVIEDLPESKPLGFTYEPIAPNFYKLINNITYFEFNGTYYEELNGVFVPAIASTVNGTFTLKPATSIEAAGTDGEPFPSSQKGSALACQDAASTI